MRYAAEVVAPGAPPRERLRRLALLARRPDAQSLFVRLRCERGAEIAANLGFPQGTADAIRALDEHWDGKGHPRGLRGDAIPLAARIMCLAQTADVFTTARGVEGALAVARERRGTWFDPALVDLLDAGTLRALPAPADGLEAAVAAHEPAALVLVGDDARVDRVADAFAGLIDAKSPSTAGHSHRVAALVVAAAQELGEPATPRDRARGAAARHRQALALQPAARQAGAPHRAGVGGGARPSAAHGAPAQPRRAAAARRGDRRRAPRAARRQRLPARARGDELPLAARLLAVADVYEAVTAERPYRAPLRPDSAAALLRDEAAAGRLDRDCVEALVASRRAAGG